MIKLSRAKPSIIFLDSFKWSISLNNFFTISCCAEFQVRRELNNLQEEIKQEREQRKYSL